MPLNLTPSFIAEGNKEVVKPMTLFRVTIDSDPANDLYFASSNANITYFRRDNGVDTPQVYLASGIREEKVAYSSSQNDVKVDITIADSNRVIKAYCESMNGLKSKKVTIRKVWANKLSDPDDFKEDVFFVESCEYSSNGFVKFTLATKLSAYDISLPLAIFSQSCRPQVTYKGQGCWIDNNDGTFSRPNGFDESEFILLNSEVVSVGTVLNQSIVFTPKNLTGFNKATDKLTLWLKTSSLTAIAGRTLTITLASDGLGTGPRLTYTISNLSTYLVVANTYAKITIDLADFTTADGLPDSSVVNFLRLLTNTLVSSATLTFKNPSVKVIKPYKYMLDNDQCSKTIQDCMRHNNVNRFGGFPGIKKKRFAG